MNCHTIAGTAANGTFGPDLTHLMSRATIAAGAAANTPENLRAWIQDPDTFKPGALMPAMQLSDQQDRRSRGVPFHPALKDRSDGRPDLTDSRLS